jgi:pilus assembly protein Flp/PilA
MTKFFADFLRDESGASAAEYVILVGVMGALVAGGAFIFGGKLKTAMDDAGQKTIDCVADSTGNCAPSN